MVDPAARGVANRFTESLSKLSSAKEEVNTEIVRGDCFIGFAYGLEFWQKCLDLERGSRFKSDVGAGVNHLCHIDDDIHVLDRVIAAIT